MIKKIFRILSINLKRIYLGGNIIESGNTIHYSLESNIEKTSQSSEDYIQTKSTASVQGTPRSKSNITSSSSLEAKKLAGKPKKRVSFNDDLIQVHLIPFNNYTPYVNLEQYKYQLRMMQSNTIDPYSYEDYDIPSENENGN